MRPFISRYPGFLAGSAEFRDLQRAQEPELLDLWSARDSALEQLCADTANWGLRYWEETLGIPVDEEKDLEARRNRVKAKLMGADVSTVALVERVAELHTGIPAKVLEYPNQFWVELSFGLGGGPPGNLEGLVETLREIMPAHLGWGLRFWLEVEGSLHIGGGFGGSVLAEIPEEPDKTDFYDTVRTAGAFGAMAAPGVPEDGAPPPAATILRVGGCMSIISNLSEGE